MVQINQERREKPRIAFHVPVSVMGINAQARIVDFSLNGFFVQINAGEKLKKGQYVRLALRFPHQEKITFIKARVVRLEDSGFGCQFIDLDPQALEQLEINFDIFSAMLPIE